MSYPAINWRYRFHREISFCIRVVAAFLVMATLNKFASANDYPCKPHGEIGNYHHPVEKMDMNYLVRFRFGKYSFAVPYAYESGPFSADRVNCSPIRDAFMFEFWMPDLRAALQDYFYTPDFRPNEEGKPNPTINDFLVQVYYMSALPDGTDVPGFPFPNIRDEYMENYERNPVLDGQLIHISRPGQWMELYVNFNDGREETMLECSGDYACEVNIYYRDLKLAIQGYIPKDALPQWREVKEGIRTLLERWIVKR